MKTAIRVIATAFLLSAVAVPAFATPGMSVICRFLSGSCPLEKNQKGMETDKADKMSMSSDRMSSSDVQSVNQAQQDVRDRFLSNNYRDRDRMSHRPMNQE